MAWFFTSVSCLYVLLASSLASFHCCVCFNFLQLLLHLHFLKQTYDSTTHHALILSLENRKAKNYFPALHTAAFHSVKFKHTFLQDSSKPEVSSHYYKSMKQFTRECFCPAICHCDVLSPKNFTVALVPAFNNTKNTSQGEGGVALLLAVVCKEPEVRKTPPPLDMRVEGRMQNKIKLCMNIQF